MKRFFGKNKKDEEIGFLKKQLLEKDEEIKKLKKQVEQYDIIHQTIKQDFSSVRRKYESLKVSLNSILEDKEEEIKKIEKQINDAEREEIINEFPVKMHSKTISASSTSSTSREGNMVIKKAEELKREKKKLEIEASELRKQNEVLQNQTVLYQEITKNITEKQKELTEIKSKIESGDYQLLDKLLEVKGELKELEFRLAELLKEKEKLTQKVVSYNTQSGNILVGNKFGNNTNLSYNRIEEIIEELNIGTSQEQQARTLQPPTFPKS